MPDYLSEPPRALRNSWKSGRASCGPGRGLGVILDPEDRQLAVAETLDRPVVQIHVGHLQLAGALHRPLIPSTAKP